jgi:hypothetical protein
MRSAPFALGASSIRCSRSSRWRASLQFPSTAGVLQTADGMPILLRSSVAGGDSYRLSEEHRSSLGELIERELHGWPLRLPTPTSPHRHRDTRPRSDPGMRARIASIPPPPFSPGRCRRVSELSARRRQSSPRFPMVFRLRCSLRAWWSRWTGKNSVTALGRRSWSAQGRCGADDRSICQRHSMPGPIVSSTYIAEPVECRRV